MISILTVKMCADSARFASGFLDLFKFSAAIIGALFLSLSVGNTADIRPLTRSELAALAAVDREIAVCQDLVTARKFDAAGIKLQTLNETLANPRSQVHGISPLPHPQVECLRARVLLGKGAATQAAVVLAPWSSSATSGITVRFGRIAEHGELELCAADTALALGQLDQALRWFDALAGSATTADAIRVRAALGCGRTLLAQGDDAGALDSLDFAAKYGRVRLYNQDGAYTALFTEIDEWIARARRVAEIRRLGLDFVLFRDAESLRRQQRAPDKALLVYRELLAQSATGAFSDASRVAAALCLISTGKMADGTAELVKFTTDFPDSLHAGEALVELGRLAVVQDRNVALAQTFITRADAWVIRARTLKITIADLPMKPAARRLTAGPKQEKTKDFFGNYDRVAIAPGVLLNQATCSWYVNDIEEKIAKWSGLLLLVQGDPAGAKRQFARLADLDQENATTNRDGNDRSRLMWAADHGYFFAYPQELAWYPQPQMRLGIFLADFLYCTENFADAKVQAERLIAGGYGRLEGAQLDYPSFLRANCIFHLDGRGAAIPALLEVADTAQSQFTRDRARFIVGNLALDGTAGKDQERAIKHLRDLVANGGDGPWKWRAQLAWAFYADQAGRHTEALAALDAMPASSGAFKELAGVMKRDVLSASAARALMSAPSATGASHAVKSATGASHAVKSATGASLVIKSATGAFRVIKSATAAVGPSATAGATSKPPNATSTIPAKPDSSTATADTK